MLFFRLLALLIVSYVVFLVLAHVTQRRPAPAPEEGEGDVEGFTTPLGVAYPDADAPLLAADDAPLRVLKDLHVDRFVTYAHRTLMANADLEDGPVHRRDPDAQESIPAFVRRCVQAAHKDAACVAVAVFAPSETDVRCVCKRRRRPRSHRRRRSGSSDERAPVVVDAHAAWTLRETEPQEAASQGAVESQESLPYASQGGSQSQQYATQETPLSEESGVAFGPVVHTS